MIQSRSLAALLAVTLVPAPALAAAQTGSTARPPARAGKPQLQPAFEELVSKAVAAREGGQLDEAVRLYREALRLKPSWIEGHWLVGTILYDLNQHAEARDAFNRVVIAQAKNGPAVALRGLCEFQLKNYEGALADIQRARSLGLGRNEELNSVTAYHAGILLNRFEQYELAFEVLRDFAFRGSDSPSVIEAFGLGLLRLPYLPSEAPTDKREMILMAGRAAFMLAKSQGRRSMASRIAFEEMVARYPEEPNVHYAFGAYLLPEEPDAGLEELNRVLRMKPNHLHATLQIAFEHIKRTNYQEALLLAQKAVEQAPSLFAARNALGRALLELGQTERAIEELEIGVRLAPDSPDMYFALARAYQRAGRKQDADRARVQFLKLDKEYRAARMGPHSVGGKDAEPVAQPPN